MNDQKIDQLIYELNMKYKNEKDLYRYLYKKYDGKYGDLVLFTTYLLKELINYKELVKEL
jgi:hypothetical protein